MAKIDYLTARIIKDRDLAEDFFDYLQGPPVGLFFNQVELDYIKKLILRARNDVKIATLNAVMKQKGFSRLSAGTNRIVYRYYEDPSFVVKVALDRVGLQNNLDEFKNQRFLKPYVCKIFDTTPDGLMATIERVNPITTKAEFDTMLNDVFYIIVTKFIGEMVSDDIGKNYFKNYGVRPGFGPVLLDYPYFYKLDPEKLFCWNLDEHNRRCNGLIDYDDGFNHLYCRKCGKRYYALDLEDKNPRNNIIIHKGGRFPMKTSISRNGQVIGISNTSDFIAPRPKTHVTSGFSALKCSISKGGFVEPNKSEIVDEPKEEKKPIEDVKVEVAVEEVTTDTEDLTKEEEIPNYNKVEIFKKDEAGNVLSQLVPNSELGKWIADGWTTLVPDIITDDSDDKIHEDETGKEEPETVTLYKEDGNGGVTEKQFPSDKVKSALKSGWNPNKEYKLLKSSMDMDIKKKNEKASSGPKMAGGAKIKKKGSTRSNFIPEVK